MNDAYYNSDNCVSDGHDNWVAQQEREHRKRLEMLSKFTDGDQRYLKEPLFRQVIEALARDADAYTLIEKLLDLNKKQHDRIVSFISHWPSRIPIPSIT